MQGRSEGGPGVPVTPPLSAVFKQTTYSNAMTIMFDKV